MVDQDPGTEFRRLTFSTTELEATQYALERCFNDPGRDKLISLKDLHSSLWKVRIARLLPFEAEIGPHVKMSTVIYASVVTMNKKRLTDWSETIVEASCRVAEKYPIQFSDNVFRVQFPDGSSLVFDKERGFDHPANQ
jgi:hypothetical protein